jgi:hypothetical protein
MLRCDKKPVERYEVEFEYLDDHQEPIKEEYIADIGPHAAVQGEVDGQRRMLEDVPRVSQKKPYRGELCPCEVAWIGTLPGIIYSMHRRYTVKKL